MGKFNLIEEPWISVLTDEKGTTKEVSLIDLFQNAGRYKDLAGDSPTQNFAILRLLLAILHTVFSRFDADGQPYHYFEIDDRLRQISTIDEEDVEDYSEDLYRTWNEMWQNKEFKDIIYQYLNTWHDRFYLFDDKFPFYQVTEAVIAPDKISKKKASSVSGKTINRLVSESGNKIALFSPKHGSNKEILTAPEIARWLVTFQGYSGLSDKVIFGKEKYRASKGWLFDIGGVFLKGNNLFETLLLNLVLVHPKSEHIEYKQKPCWEYSSQEIVDRSFSINKVNNIAELYTNWSRAIYIDLETDISKAFSFNIVKLPDIEHQDQFLEPMTIWRYNKSGENKGKHTPRKHQAGQSMWRSFGLITLPNSYEEDQERPSIMNWIDNISESINNFDITIESVSMKDDGNATSWVPVDEIYDSLKINDLLITDSADDGWLIRINEAVDRTKEVVGETYRRFLVDVRNIRKLDSNHQFVNRGVEDLYYAIDQPFREWLSSIKPADSKREKISQWYNSLDQIVDDHAEKVLENATYRDYIGIKSEDQKNNGANIITAYNKFKYFLNKQ
ncbi:type I-E CRISPR-associated protein Cse1/CasA [Proteinivorax hydrogeniformans]|uniref:Type I-E CRISPR-associated protein Cse1/CasA n=1 Tax=Proteinivorax hydrogeniformans TaxID=1826727 RepID=A0AAU8HVB3_9FIRM